MTNKKEQLIEELANIIEHLMAYYKPTKKICYVVASELYREYESLGYAQKDPDQSLPVNLFEDSDTLVNGYFRYGSYSQAQQDMLKAGWIKVKELK